MLKVQPIEFAEACEYIRARHRHHRPPIGYKFALAANDGEKVVGVLVAGRPVARMLDDGRSIEVTRLCTDGARNACSILYAHAWKATKALGYRRMLTYTMPEEGGASLKAVGAVCVGEAGGGKWVKTVGAERIERANDWPLQVKWRWEWINDDAGERFAVVIKQPPAAQMSLFAGVDE